MSENQGTYIAQAKKEYRKIGYVKCSAFYNEKIYFNGKGFKHLLYKKGDRRNKDDRNNRLSLMKSAVEIVSSSRIFHEYRYKDSMCFWSLKKYTYKQIIIVIICQSDNGSKYFLSVMNKFFKSTKTP